MSGIALGIVVDDTIHFMNRIVDGKRNGNTLSLTLTNHDAKSGKSISGSVSMQLSGGGHALSNTVHAKDRDSGKKFRILSLSMKK